MIVFPTSKHCFRSHGVFLRAADLSKAYSEAFFGAFRNTFCAEVDEVATVLKSKGNASKARAGPRIPSVCRS